MTARIETFIMNRHPVRLAVLNWADPKSHTHLHLSAVRSYCALIVRSQIQALTHKLIYLKALVWWGTGVSHFSALIYFSVFLS